MVETHFKWRKVVVRILSVAADGVQYCSSDSVEVVLYGIHAHVTILSHYRFNPLIRPFPVLLCR